MNERNEAPTNVARLAVDDGRNEVWEFPDGTVVTMTVPISEPSISIKHAVFCLSSILHQIHQAMF